MPKRLKYITMFFISVIVFLCVLIWIQRDEINHCHKTIETWEELSVKWREKLDTCYERNQRIYDELYNLQEYKIMKLKEQGVIKRH